MVTEKWTQNYATQKVAFLIPVLAVKDQKDPSKLLMQIFGPVKH